MAQLIARIVRRGAHVSATTHSEFLPESLSHLVRFSSVKNLPEGISQEDTLDPQNVGLHVFRPNEEGYRKANPIPVNKTEGNPQDEFNRVVDLLFSRARQIEPSTIRNGNV